jgi:hypothetical protein
MSKEEAKGWSVLLLVLGLAVLLRPVAAGADELSDLKQELQEQKQRSSELENRINQLEARQKLKERSLNEKIDAVEAKTEQTGDATTGLPDSLKWLEKINISGDFRYRYEYIDLEDRPTRNRNRIRARLMISAMVNNEWDLVFRMATGETDIVDDTIIADPVSTNQTLGEFGSRKDFWLDLAYFDYHPAGIEGLNVLGGKIKNPFLVVGKNQLMWDSDLNPEGVGLTYSLPFGESFVVGLSGGGFWLNEESSGADTSLWGIQAHARKDLSGSDHALVGAGWYDYGNLQGLEDEFGIGFGNTIDPGTGAWVYDYDIFELLAEYGTQIGKVPVSVFGTWVKNCAAGNGEDTGWLVGATAGKAKEPGSYQFGYDYRDVERDAVLAVWNDSDFNAGRTGGEGHVLRFAYQAFKNVQLALTYFHSEITYTDPELDYRRLQADVKLKF